MADLPTCWYCPECGFVDNFCWKGPHYVPDQSRKCAGAMIESPAIPPGTPLPVILDALGHTYREGWFSQDDDGTWSAVGYDHIGRPVLVVDNPATDEAHDG